jgi:hypothetical protein
MRLAFIFSTWKHTKKLSYAQISNQQHCHPGLPDFSRHKIPKRGKMHKFPQNTPNGRKIAQMAIQYNNTFLCKTLKDLLNLGFLV